MLQPSKIQKSELIIHIGCFLFVILWALVQLWNSRFFEHYNDGVSYLDMASYYRQGDWQSAFNSFWNLLYPAVIAIVFSVLRPDAFNEFLALKLVNFVIFLFLLGSFEYFFGTFMQFYSDQNAASNEFFSISRSAWLLIGYGIFSYTFLCLNNIATDTPDMLSAACMLVALTSVLKIWRRVHVAKDYFLFGLFSGLAYLAKAAALPAVLICLPFLWWQSHKERQSLKWFYAALVTMILIILPYIICLSIKVGEPTISTAAKLNYIWFLDEKKWGVHGPESEDRRRSLQHAMRQIYSNPSVFEFAQPVKGTYPPWYDPYYWYAGYKTQMHLDWLLITLLCNLAYFGMFFFLSLLSTIAVIRISYRESIISKASFLSSAPLLVVAVIGFLQYAFVINLWAVYPAFTNRYFSLPVFLFVLATMACLRIKNSQRGILSLKLGLAMIVLILGTSLTGHLAGDLQEACKPQYFEHAIVATELKKLGLHEGDYVAQIGTEEPLIDWARLAKLKLVADIPDSKKFWDISERQRREIFSLLRQKDIKMAIYYSAPISAQAKALQKYNHENWSKQSPKAGQIEGPKTIEPPQNEGWHRLAQLSCWVHKI